MKTRFLRLLCRIGLHARPVPFQEQPARQDKRWLGHCPRCGRLRWVKGNPPPRRFTLFLDLDLSRSPAPYLLPRR